MMSHEAKYLIAKAMMDHGKLLNNSNIYDNAFNFCVLVLYEIFESDLSVADVVDVLDLLIEAKAELSTNGVSGCESLRESFREEFGV